MGDATTERNRVLMVILFLGGKGEGAPVCHERSAFSHGPLAYAVWYTTVESEDRPTCYARAPAPHVPQR